VTLKGEKSSKNLRIVKDKKGNAQITLFSGCKKQYFYALRVYLKMYKFNSLFQSQA
jgi:hypothetical protein